MSKGLPRSLSRGEKNKQELVKERIEINHTVTVTSTGSAIGFGTTEIMDLPEGFINFLAGVAYLTFSGSGSDDNLSDTWSGDFGIGITPIGDATITGPDSYIVESTAIGPATAEVISGGVGKANQEVFDNTDLSKEINLNLLIDAADIVDDESVEITVTGELWIVYTVLGDN